MPVGFQVGAERRWDAANKLELLSVGELCCLRFDVMAPFARS